MSTVPLRSVATVLVSNVDKKSAEGQSPVRLCNYTDVYYNRLLHQGLAYKAATATREQMRSFALRVGDTVITKDSETADDIGASALVTETAADFVCGYHLAILRPGRGLEPRYLQWQVSSQFVQEQLATRSSGVTRFGLTYEGIRGVRLKVPALEEQRRIADFLDEQIDRLDGVLEAVQDLVRAAELQRASRLAEAYRDLPTPDLLEGRGTRSVVSVRGLTVATISGGTPATGALSNWDDEGLPWIAIGDMVDGGTTLATRKGLSAAGMVAARLRPAPRGTILLAMYASVGKTTVTGMRAVWNQAVLGLIPRPGVDPDFLLGWLELARPSLPAIARSATQDNLNADQVARLRVPRRTSAEQQQIGALRRAASHDHAQLLAVARRMERLVDERKRALITACVTGELDVRAASDRASAAARSGTASVGLGR